MTARQRGVFITLEGGDGAGKTTQAELLEGWLNAAGRSVVRTREPGGTDTGRAIRELLLHAPIEIDPRAEALLYAADRAQHVAEVVRPALERGDVVVQDRYIDSSLAYQGAGRVLETADVQYLSEWGTGGLWPDLTILLDIAPEDGVLRRQGRGAGDDRLEREALSFHAAVREGFLALARTHPERYLVLNARDEVQTLHSRVTERVATLF